MENDVFSTSSYLQWVEDQFFSTLRIMNQTKGGNVERKIFQAERTILKQFGFISGNIRRGLGLEINWPIVQRTLEFEL